MKVLVTGANGFIGKNLRLRLGTMPGVEVVPYDIEDDFALIESCIADVDFVFHLAGVNRPDKVEEFYSGNTDLTKALVDLMIEKDATPAVVLASSIQAALENDYGKSKRLAEEAVLSLRGRAAVYVYRFHNVFGKWCRPHYNSVVATFCSNIMRGQPIVVNDPARVMELVYIDDIVDEFALLLRGGEPRYPVGDLFEVRPVYEIRLDELARAIEGFKDDLAGILVPETGDPFTRKLFSTFVSYAERGDILATPQLHEDQRGSFAELIHTRGAGQVSVSVSKKGVVRGNHFHDTKMEKFIVVHGRARIAFRHMATGDTMEFEVSGDAPQIVTIPVGYTHNIENTGEGDMVLLIWANELFDPERPDTFFDEV
jgi:UDP-2-acetamido-2,6-beta-L-arabino-hexul-4-ose reductase